MTRITLKWLKYMLEQDTLRLEYSASMEASEQHLMGRIEAWNICIDKFAEMQV